MVKKSCPVCGKPIKRSFLFNVWMFGRKGNSIVYFCENPDCKGWFCTKCDGWHSWGTSCSLAQLRGNAIYCQEDWDLIKGKMSEQEMSHIRCMWDKQK
jgi:hypothetical protein